MRPIITLTTDFGEADPYVAAMKGVIYGICPQAEVVDLTHQIPPQDVLAAAFFLRETLPYWPAGTIHVVVVDPGVGTTRRPLAVLVGNKTVVCPDNGVLSWVVLQGCNARYIQNPALMREEISATFQGRDIFAPVAAHLANGTRLEDVGPLVEEVVRLEIPLLEHHGATLLGEVVYVDRFGNLITNIPADAVGGGFKFIGFGGFRVERLCRTFAETPPGEPGALIGSGGWLEIVANGASARDLFGVDRGDSVIVHR